MATDEVPRPVDDEVRAERQPPRSVAAAAAAAWQNRRVLQACVNGARRPGDHPGLPVTPAGLAEDMARVVTAGVDAVHLHVKDANGVDTFGGGELGKVLAAVRAAAPGVPVGVSTGAWALPDPGERVAAIRAWPDLPDFASVNWHEPGADDVAKALLARGVAVEAGLWHADAAGAWLASPHRDRSLRVLLELPDGLDPAGSEAEADRLLAAVTADTGDRVPVLLHGEGSSCWPALRHAARLGLATRIGLEDVLTLPDGSPAPDNTSLVLAARALLRAHTPGG